MTDRSQLCYRLNLHSDPYCTCAVCMQKVFQYVGKLEREVAALKERIKNKAKT